MKKLILSMLILACATTGVYAQKANVNKAKSKATSEVPNFVEARELIAPALVDETTKNEANTWYVAGLIGFYEKNAIDAANPAPTPEVKSQLVEQKGKSALESYDYLIKADSLDQIPNEKGKVKLRYRKDIQNMMLTYAMNFIEYGAALFDTRQYPEAYHVFHKYVELVDLPLMENSIPKDSTYSMIKYFAAIAATSANMSNESIALYEELKGENYEGITVYQLLAEEYGKMKNEAKFEKTLMEGAQLFPQEPWFLQKLINHYIEAEEFDKALSYLNEAIKKNPNSAEYRFVEGGVKESIGDIDGAIASFKKSKELDPKKGEADAEIGRIYYNKATVLEDGASNIKDTKKVREIEKQVDVELMNALPYYQNAAKLNPKKSNYKIILRSIYYRLKMDKEYDEIEKEINAM